VILGAAIDNWIGLALGVAVLVYLVIVLVVPERF
jgi:K+-transporting ATPase KdpF subunit